MNNRVGFIGLGDLGEPMAARILAAGFNVTSCAYRRRTAIDTLRQDGLVEVSDPFEVGERSDILITMVVDEEQTDKVLRGPRGALASLAEGSTVAVMSTVTPEYCQLLAHEVAERRIGVLDCPVSGTRFRAEQGQLSLICGGDRVLLDRCRPILETMGDVIHCGATGMGQVAKLANQGLIASYFRLAIEARELAEAYSMDLDTLMRVLSQSTGTSFIVENWDKLAPHFPHYSPLWAKDLALCLAAARRKQIELPLVTATARVFKEEEGQ